MLVIRFRKCAPPLFRIGGSPARFEFRPNTLMQSPGYMQTDNNEKKSCSGSSSLRRAVRSWAARAKKICLFLYDTAFVNFWFFLAVYFLMIAGPDYLPRIFVHHDQTPLTFAGVVSALAGYLLLAAPLFFLRKFWFRLYASLLTFFAALGFFVSGYVVLRFHSPLHTGTLDLVSTTSWRESREFLHREILSLSGVYYFLATVTGLLILRYIGMRAREPFPDRKRSLAAGGVCVLPMVCVFVFFMWVRPDPVLRRSAAWFSLLPHQWSGFRRQMAVLHDCVKHPQIPADLTLDGPADVAVLVIGESAARTHLSLYGYERETTPEMDGMRDELVVFRNVISAMPVTNHSLYYALTFKTLSDHMHPRATLMSVLDHAGYHIDAYSTQENFGENSVSALFTQWRPRYHEEEFDECLLDDVREALANRNGPTLIILHIMGSHITYRNRYPDSFSYFTAETAGASAPGVNPLFQENIDTYDNSIRYTDYVLCRIIDELKKAGGKNFLFYFSDHGENVETGFNQNYRDPEKTDSYEVPFLFWFSPEFREAYPDRVEAAEAAVDRPIQLDRAAEGVLSVFGVSSKEYPASENFLLPEFAVKPRYLMEGRILYEERTSPQR